MQIKGYVHISEDEAFLANVHIVHDVRFYAGVVVGYMYLTSGELVEVKEHPAGGYNGSIIGDW